MPERPTPLSRTDELIAALHDEVAGLRSDLAAQRGGAPPGPDEQGRVELREPAEPSTETARPASAKKKPGGGRSKS